MQTVVNKVHTLFLVFFKLRNTTQGTSLSFRFLQLFLFTSRLENILKTSEDQVETPSAVIWFDVMYPRTYLKTLKSRSVFLFFLYQYYYKKIKRSSGSSGTSRTYTQQNQNTGEDFLEKVSRFYDSVFGVFRNTSSK